MDEEGRFAILVVMWYVKWEKWKGEVGFEIDNSPLPKPISKYHQEESNQSIFDILGKYDPSKQKITIYEERIKMVAKELDCEFEDLKEVVLIHESAHTLIHLGIKENETIKGGKRLLRRLDKINDSIDERLHEVFAQIITRNYLKRRYPFNLNSASLNAYDKLEEKQPWQYRLGKLKHADPRALIKCIELFKFKGLVADIETWSTITSLIPDSP